MVDPLDVYLEKRRKHLQEFISIQTTFFVPKEYYPSKILNENTKWNMLVDGMWIRLKALVHLSVNKKRETDYICHWDCSHIK